MKESKEDGGKDKVGCCWTVESNRKEKGKTHGGEGYITKILVGH